MADRPGVAVTRVTRDPICPWCRHRHPYGQAVAWYDNRWGLWRCGRCDMPLDAVGDCPTEKCCGYDERKLGWVQGHGRVA